MLTKLLNYFRTPIGIPVERVGDDNSADLTNGINEPVLSFVHCFKENPKRFKLIPLMVYTKDEERGYQYLLVDTYLNKSYFWEDKWEYERLETFMYDERTSNICNLRCVISEEEGLYIRANLREYYSERKERLDKLRDVREKRRLAQEDLLEQQSNAKMRAELMEVYCKGKITSDEQDERWMMEGG